MDVKPVASVLMAVALLVTRTVNAVGPYSPHELQRPNAQFGIYRLKVSSDNSTVAAASTSTTYIWNLQARAYLGALAGGYQHHAFTFTPDSRHLLVSTVDETVETRASAPFWTIWHN